MFLFSSVKWKEKKVKSNFLGSGRKNKKSMRTKFCGWPLHLEVSERNNDFFIVKENQIELFDLLSSFTHVTLPTLRFHCPDSLSKSNPIKICFKKPLNIFMSIVKISLDL